METESDIEVLRQTARLLEHENARLHRRLLDLTHALALAQGTTATQLALELAQLQEQLAARTRQLFGASSEKRPRPKDQGDSGATPAPGSDAPPRTGHGPRQQLALPVVEVQHALDVPDQMCPKCGGDLKLWEGQFEDSEEVDVVERSFRIVRHRRQKYRCQCASCVETALGPPKLIAGGRYSVDFAVAVAIAKYADHLPLARQVKQMVRQGLIVDSQTLWDQLFALHHHLAPSARALHAWVLSHPVVGADETTWRLMEKGGSAKWWVWAVSCPQAVYYEILASRSAKAAERLLGSYRGIVMADGYGAYGALCKEIVDRHNTRPFELANCWAHARRKLLEAQPHCPAVDDVLEMIAKLYGIEAGVREARCADPGQRALRLLEARQTQSASVVEDIRQWLTAQGLQARRQSALGKAIGYAFDLWPGLTKFLGNAAIPLDNNQTERGLRAVAVGRKNHYGSRSLRGPQVAATFYSLIESARLCGVEPSTFLRQATLRAIDNPGTVTLPIDLLNLDSG